MELSYRPAFCAVMVMLSSVTLLGCEDGAPAKPVEGPAKPVEGFVILRDPGFGKPLVSWRIPPKDADGRQAIDVLEQFLTHVRDGDVDSAKQLCRFKVWTLKDRGSMGFVTKTNLPADPKYRQQAQAEFEALEERFPAFVEDLRRAKKFTLGATIKQKPIYWTIRIVADGVEKQPWPKWVYLSYEDNIWKIEIDDIGIPD